MGFIDGFKKAFAIPEEEKRLNEEEEIIIKKIADSIIKRGLTAPSIMFLESVKNLNFIGSQVMLFFQPIVKAIFPTENYDKIQRILEKRCSIEYLIKAIEEKK